jgi:hypothetical protein
MSNSTPQSWQRPGFIWCLPPAALAVLELWHPVIHSGTAAGLQPLVSHTHVWLSVHLVQLVLFALTALSVSRLLVGVGSIAANTARVALSVFAIAYSAFDTFAGLATGSIVTAAASMSPDNQAVALMLANELFDSPINAFLFMTGTTAWCVGAAVTALVMFKAGAERIPTLLLFVAALVLWGDHPPPFGPITFGLVAVSLLWFAWGARGRHPASSKETHTIIEGNQSP